MCSLYSAICSAYQIHSICDLNIPYRRALHVTRCAFLYQIQPISALYRTIWVLYNVIPYSLYPLDMSQYVLLYALCMYHTRWPICISYIIHIFTIYSILCFTCGLYACHTSPTFYMSSAYKSPYMLYLSQPVVLLLRKLLKAKWIIGCLQDAHSLKHHIVYTPVHWR